MRIRTLNHAHTQQVSKEDSLNRIPHSFPFVNLDCCIGPSAKHVKKALLCVCLCLCEGMYTRVCKSMCVCEHFEIRNQPREVIFAGQ